MHMEHFTTHTLEYTTNLTAIQNLPKHKIEGSEKKKETITLYQRCVIAYFLKFNYQIHYRMFQFYPITLPIKSIGQKPNYFPIINYITTCLRQKQKRHDK